MLSSSCRRCVYSLTAPMLQFKGTHSVASTAASRAKGRRRKTSDHMDVVPAATATLSPDLGASINSAAQDIAVNPTVMPDTPYVSVFTTNAAKALESLCQNNDPSATTVEEEAVASECSNGEEELLSEQSMNDPMTQDAQDMSDPQEATIINPTAKAHDDDAGGGILPAAKDKYIPTSTTGRPFYGPHSALLAEAATQKGFQSPMWATAEAFSRCGASLACDAAEGILLPDISPPTRVYNLEQTDHKGSPHAVKARADDSFINLCHKPRDICGWALPPHSLESIQSHPLFRTYHDQCPLWISFFECYRLRESVKEGELHNFIKVPVWKRVTRTTTGLDDDFHARADALGVDLAEYNVFYNVQQLCNAERFTSRGFKDRIQCYSVSGHRYSPSVALLMYEYCLKYYFPVDGVTIWATENRVKSLGGCVNIERRYPPSSASALGVVPPPFMDIVRGEIVSLVNAEQTDICDALVERAMKDRKDNYKRRNETSEMKKENAC